MIVLLAATLYEESAYASVYGETRRGGLAARNGREAAIAEVCGLDMHVDSV